MTPTHVLDFWFDAASEPFWFARNAGFDAAVAAHLSAAHEAAAKGALDAWTATADGTLALVLLLDQVPRNLFRGTARAFATDAAALAVALKGLAAGLDRTFAKDRKLFLYLPLEHAEDLALQERSVALFAALGDPEWLRYAVLHRDIIARFGRFPHRNVALGRISTPAELRFLEEPNSSF